MEINTNQFEFNHGKLPRGAGNWAFADNRNPKPEQIFWFNSNYRDAKRAAKVHFRHKTDVVFVLP